MEQLAYLLEQLSMKWRAPAAMASHRVPALRAATGTEQPATAHTQPLEPAVGLNWLLLKRETLGREQSFAQKQMTPKMTKSGVICFETSEAASKKILNHRKGFDVLTSLANRSASNGEHKPRPPYDPFRAARGPSLL